MIYYANPADFDWPFCERLLEKLPQEKKKDILAIRHAPSKKNALLAWALLSFAFRLRNGAGRMPALCFLPAGKPYLEGEPFHFNLSHTDTLVCLAAADRPVGVDAQTVTLPSDGVVKRVLTKAEQAILAERDDKAAVFTSFWTMKEAFVKWSGEGIARGLQTLDFAPYIGQTKFEALDQPFFTTRISDAVLTLCGDRDNTLCLVTKADLAEVLDLEIEG